MLRSHDKGLKGNGLSTGRKKWHETSIWPRSSRTWLGRPFGYYKYKDDLESSFLRKGSPVFTALRKVKTQLGKRVNLTEGGNPEVQPSTSGTSKTAKTNATASFKRKRRTSYTDSSDSDESVALSKIVVDSDEDFDPFIDNGKQQPDTEDASCLFCDSKFSADSRGELWVQCVICCLWAHNECAGAEKDVYICDFCR